MTTTTFKSASYGEGTQVQVGTGIHQPGSAFKTEPLKIIGDQPVVGLGLTMIFHNQDGITRSAANGNPVLEPDAAQIASYVRLVEETVQANMDLLPLGASPVVSTSHYTPIISTTKVTVWFPVRAWHSLRDVVDRLEAGKNGSPRLKQIVHSTTPVFSDPPEHRPRLFPGVGNAPTRGLGL